MSLELTETRIGNVLTRTGGYLTAVASHSLQPYRGCSYGNALCGVGCYVQHSRVSPLLPIAEPDRFFARLADLADAVVIDHFIQGDGTAAGTRTLRTDLPQAMQAVDPASVTLEYRDRLSGIRVAR